MKKLLTLLLSLFMILSLVGCNSNKDEEEAITHVHAYEVDEDGVWVCRDDNDILSNTDKPYVAVLENNEPKDIIPLDSITSNETNLGNGVIYKEDNTIFYNGNNAQTIIIKTEKDNKNNEDKVVINAPNDTVYHYGSSSVISLDAVATNSFHEYGKVDLITLTVARIVLETLSNVKEIYLDINNPNYNYESAIIAIKEEVEIPNLSRDTVNLQEGEVKTLAVIQQLKDEIKQDNTIETKTEEESFVKIENVGKSDKDLIIQAFLSPNADTKDKTKLETKQTSTVTLEEAKEGSNHPASKNVFVSKDEKVIEVVKPQETSKKDETKQETKPVVTPTVTPTKQEETKKDDPTPTPTPSVTKYTVTFDMQGHGTQVPSQSVKKGKKATEPTDPTATNYIFGGWYKEAACTNEWIFDTDTVTADTTLYAKWIAKTWGVAVYFNNDWTDIPMTETEEGVFVSPAIELTTSDQFKVRYGGGWDMYYGASEGPIPYEITSGTPVSAMEDGENLAVPTDGEYIVTLDRTPYNETITVTATSTIKTIADVLATNPYFPTTVTNAWTNTNGDKCYLNGEYLVVADNSYSIDSYPIEKSGKNDYKSDTEDCTLTFNITNGVLTSITVQGSGDGTYTAPTAPTAEILSIGGKIFHIVDGDNGATYHFYSDEAGTQEITGWSDVASLTNAKSYSVEGTPTSDKFYVMGTDGSGNPLTVSGSWGDNSIGVNTDSVGAGKSNTDSLINSDGTVDGTVWKAIAELRATAGGHNDWFVGTKAEQDKLIASGLASSLYSDITYAYWASVEFGGSEACVYANNKWDSCPKWAPQTAVALRAF